MTSALERARARILGDERVVVIEAAAGCGKTYEAVGAIAELSQQLVDGQQVLLLTHTNSARRVFEGRLADGDGRSRMQTLDSIAFEVVNRYARHLGLEQPVVPDAIHRGHPSFKDIRTMARGLLKAAPAVAEGLAWRHPVILVDEHQDSSDDQHSLVAAIAEPGTARVRYFGDRLQSIYGFGRRRRVGPAVRRARRGDARVRASLEGQRRPPRLAPRRPPGAARRRTHRPARPPELRPRAPVERPAAGRQPEGTLPRGVGRAATAQAARP